MEVGDIISLDMLYGTVSYLHIVWHNSLKIYVLIYIYFIKFLPRNPYECLTYSNKKNDYELLLVNSCYIVFYYMTRSASGQYAANSVFWLATRAGKMERYCPPGTARFVPANKISPEFKRVHESFLSLKLISAKVERFFVISLSLWNQKKRQREWKQRKQDCR